MTYTKEQLDKLPRWAKSEIERLTSHNQSLELSLKEFKGEAETNTYLREGLNISSLPNNSQILFKVGEKKQNQVAVYIRNDGTIDVNCDSFSKHDVAILPRGCNGFKIKFID